MSISEEDIDFSSKSVCANLVKSEQSNNVTYHRKKKRSNQIKSSLFFELNLFQQQKQHVNMMTLHINAVMYTE